MTFGFLDSMSGPYSAFLGPEEKKRALLQGISGFGDAILSQGYSRTPRGPLQGIGAGATGFTSAFNDALKEGVGLQELSRRRTRDDAQDRRSEEQLGLSRNADTRAQSADTRAQSLFTQTQDEFTRKRDAGSRLSEAIKRARLNGTDLLNDPDVVGVLSELDPINTITMTQKDNKPDFMPVPESGQIFDKRSGKFIQAPGGPGGGKPLSDIAKLRADMNRLPPGSPDRALFEQAINRAATGDRAGQDFTRSNTLRDEFGTRTKEYGTVQNANAMIKSAAKADNGAGDMSMLYAYVRMLDPTSVVRESEFAAAAAAGSFGERVQGAVQHIVQGGRLAPTLRQSFVNEAENLYQVHKRGYDKTKSEYERLARQYGLDPTNVIVDIERDESDPARATALPIKPPTTQKRLKYNPQTDSLE